ncbi:MAG: insulinase family protein [Victivallales bacterium]|nr:insulinase family protein [Victivallales bacterium]
MKDYTLLCERKLPQLRSVVKVFRHKSGLEVLCMEAPDQENMFSLCLPTPPVDNTGVTHIIEHSVLAGSKRYPVKDPFMEIIKSSMATYINAITYPDHTVYPLATAVPSEFFHLASVYFDAIFNPLLTRDTFCQEGWHYELRKPGDLKSALLTNGIVYNEMSGDYFDLDNTIAREMNAAMFPDTPRQFVSGGIPAEIPSLSYEKLLEYYKVHYHPSRAKVFFYGDIPTSEKLKFLAKQLDALDFPPAPAPMPPRQRQVVWKAPQRKKVFYSPEMDIEEAKGAWSVGFFLTDQWDPLLEFAFEFLDCLLFGTAAAPLKKAILESKLCDGLSISGYDNETPENCFLVAVNGIAPEQFSKMEALVDKTLARIVKKGFQEEELQAAFNSFRIGQQAITTKHVFRQMEKVFDAWSYGIDPMTYLDTDAVLAELSRKLREDPRWLPSILKQYVCDNPRRIVLELLPDASLSAKMKRRQAAKMARKKAKLSQEQLASIDQEAAALKKRQGRPNSLEALATLPRLERNKIPRKPILQKTAVSRLSNNIALVDVDDFSNGLSYLTFAYPFSSFPKELQPQLGLFLAIMSAVGEQNLSYDKVSTRWATTGANMGFSVLRGFPHQKKGLASQEMILFHLSAFDETFETALDLLQNRLSRTVFTERERVQTVLRQMWAQAKEEVAFSNRGLVEYRAASGLNELLSRRELQSGLASIPPLKTAATQFAHEYPALCEMWECMLEALSRATPVAASFLGAPSTRKSVLRFLEKFPKGKTSREGKISTDSVLGRLEALGVNADVSSCARAFRAPLVLQSGSAALSVYANLLSCGYLWDEIRVKGGAYGARAKYDPFLGYLLFLSSQDPQPARTIQTFANVPKIQFPWRDEEVANSVISTLRASHVPVRPTTATTSAITSYLFEITDELRIQRHNEILALTPAQIRETVEKFWSQSPDCNTCIIGPERAFANLHPEKIVF